MHNPYQTPDSDLSAVEAPASGRPFSIWLILILFNLVGAIFVVGLVRHVWMMALNWSTVDKYAIFVTGWRVMLVAIVAGVILGIVRRRQWGRWLGVAAMLATAAVAIFGTDSTHYNNDAERAGGEFGRAILMPLLLFWGSYAFGFSRKAIRYFSSAPG